MNAPVNFRSIDIPTEFQSCFDKQRAAYLAAPEPSYAQRIADLRSLTRLLKDNKDELVAAINADYGNRSEFETLFAEYFVVLETIADATKNLKKWMKPQRRHVDFMTYPLARNRVIPQRSASSGSSSPRSRLDRMEHLKRSDARIRDLNGIL